MRRLSLRSIIYQMIFFIKFTSASKKSKSDRELSIISPRKSNLSSARRQFFREFLPRKGFFLRQRFSWNSYEIGKNAGAKLRSSRGRAWESVEVWSRDSRLRRNAISRFFSLQTRMKPFRAMKLLSF